MSCVPGVAPRMMELGVLPLPVQECRRAWQGSQTVPQWARAGNLARCSPAKRPQQALTLSLPIHLHKGVSVWEKGREMDPGDA